MVQDAVVAPHNSMIFQLKLDVVFHKPSLSALESTTQLVKTPCNMRESETKSPITQTECKSIKCHMQVLSTNRCSCHPREPSHTTRPKRYQHASSRSHSSLIQVDSHTLRTQVYSYPLHTSYLQSSYRDE